MATQTRRRIKGAGRPLSVQDAVTPETGYEAIASQYVPHSSHYKLFPPQKAR